MNNNENDSNKITPEIRISESIIESDIPKIRKRMNPLNKFNSEHICQYCNKKVGKYNYFKLPGKQIFYHPDHLTCIKCSEMVGNSGFYIHETDFYCSRCYFSEELLSCGQCYQKIESNYIFIGETAFHKKCLRCHTCHQRIKNECFMYPSELSNRTLTNKKTISKKYCGPCFDELNPFCWKCETRILQKRFEVSLKSYLHPKCFSCDDCKTPIGQKKFLLDKEKHHVICETCLSKK